LEHKTKLIRILFIVGACALILGAIDPMEGSLAIAAGVILIASCTMLWKDSYRNIFLASAIMILIGVFSLWFVSALGGFDPKREWWWTAFIIPYPIGWLIAVVTLVVRLIKKPKHTITVKI